jgi:hypothetical protein
LIVHVDFFGVADGAGEGGDGGRAGDDDLLMFVRERWRSVASTKPGRP